MPSYTGFSAGEVVVAIDTSGSIGEGELNMFLSELAGILDDCKPEKVCVLAIDAKVAAVTELDSGADIANNPPALKGGGGTSFRPAFEWCHENGIEPASLIYFTDMCGDFPKEAPSYPVIWCATMDYVAPWGETVRIGKEERR
jgi:predicted metal-dependent peptidase